MSNHDDITENIDTITGTDLKQRRTLLRYAAKHLDDKLLVKAVKQGDEFFYQNKNQSKALARPVLMLCGFVIALKKYKYADQAAMHRKATEEHIDIMEMLHECRRQSALRGLHKPKKKDQLLPYMPDLIKAQKEGYSLREMVEYVELKGVKVSHETIRRALNGL